MSSAAHKASKTVTRASIRRKRATQRRIAVCLLAAMMGSGAVAYCLLPPRRDGICRRTFRHFDGIDFKPVDLRVGFA